MTNPLIEKMSVAIKFRRMRLTDKACCCSVNPGAIPIWLLTKDLAIKATTIDKPAVIKKAKLVTCEKSFQASFFPSCVSTELKTGMNAIARAPPEINAKSISGKLLAALNTSNSADNPN